MESSSHISSFSRPSSSTVSFRSERPMKCISDYEVKDAIGEGSFSTVYAAIEKRDSPRNVAIKICSKRQILKEKRVASVHREKRILAMLSTKQHQHPFVVSLYATFQDADHLYFVLSYAMYGDLLHIMLKKPEKKFSLSESKFYAAELLSSLQHIHTLSIVHRDVKPENILVSASGHILLSDFGSVKDLSEPETKVDCSEIRSRRCSFVGTAQYVSPEVLCGDPVGPACDIWAFAVVIYQFLTGKHVFYDESEYLMYKRIQKLLFSYPDGFSEFAKDLIDKILVIEPEKRLGVSSVGGADALRNHAFFHGINWDNLEESKPPDLRKDFMAKVIRSRWVFRPHGRWHRYLPRRNDAVKEYNYELEGGSLNTFRDDLKGKGTEEHVVPSKLWLAWLYRDLSGEPKWTKARVLNLLGADYKVGRMEILPNTEATNQELWHLKHLIELRPISFVNGEPTGDDIYGIKLHPDGRCEVPKDTIPSDGLSLYNEKKQWSSGELNKQLAAKHFGYKDVFETNVYTNNKISIIK